jgi:hypothetical protein
VSLRLSQTSADWLNANSIAAQLPNGVGWICWCGKKRNTQVIRIPKLEPVNGLSRMARDTSPRAEGCADGAATNARSLTLSGAERPAFEKWDAPVKPGILEEIVPTDFVASPIELATAESIGGQVPVAA